MAEGLGLGLGVRDRVHVTLYATQCLCLSWSPRVGGEGAGCEYGFLDGCLCSAMLCTPECK